MDKLELLAEAHRRGILPPEKVALFEEATRRGLIKQPGPPLMAAHGGEPAPEETWRDTVSRFARPALEGGGAAVGGLIGAGAGLTTGPGAPVASPVLGVAGGGLGYAIGKKGADLLDETLGLGSNTPQVFEGKPQGIEGLITGEKKQGFADRLGNEALESVSDIGTGAALEMGGQMLVPAFMAVKAGGKTVFKMVADPVKKAVTQKGMEKAAGQILQANTSAGPIYAKNAAEAAEIEKQIPGLKFTAGQATNDPALIKLERTQMRRPGSGAEMSAEQTARNNEALRIYYQKTFGGKEGIDDLVTNLQGQRAGLQSAEQTARSAAQAEAARLPAVEPSQTGQRIVETLQKGKAGAKAQAKELYDAVPSVKIPVGEMLDDFGQISRPMSKFEDPDGIPDLLGIVKASFKPKTPHAHGGGLPPGTILDAAGKALPKAELPKVLSLDDLQGLRSELLAQSRSARSAQVPNERLASRLDQAAKAVERAISGAEGTEGAGAALKEANRFFRKDYAEVFRQGTVGDILRPGMRGEATKTPLAQIPAKVWNSRNLTAADDFIKATKDAPAIMRDHAAYDLLQNVTDAQGNIVTSKLNGWLARNRPLLKKFGLEGNFAGIAKAQRAADAASAAAGEFERSVAARVLGSDPERAVAAAFSGRNAGAEAANLMKMVSGDKAAKKGLQKAFADHLMTTIQTTAKDAAGNPVISNAAFQKTMAKYAPVMRVLYKDEPAKIAALNTMRKAYEVSVRNTRSPIGGGSDTAENVLTELGKINLLTRSATIVRGLFRIISKHGDDKVNEMVNRALFDPDYAQTLIKATQGKIPEKELQTVIDGKIVQLDAYRNARRAAAVTGMGAASGVDE